MKYKVGDFFLIYSYLFIYKGNGQMDIQREQCFGEVKKDKYGSLYILTPRGDQKIYLYNPYSYYESIFTFERNHNYTYVLIRCYTTDPDYMEGFKEECLRRLSKDLLKGGKE